MKKLKNYKVDVELNGTITFEVKAESYEKAQKQVDDLLGNTSVKEAIEEWNETMRSSTRITPYNNLEMEAR